MLKRLFFAGLSTETNTFSSIPTTADNFTVLRGEAQAVDPAQSEFRRRIFDPLTAQGCEIVFSLSASAPPGAPTQDSAYEALRDEILNDLKTALPVDAVLLSLHGAMVSQSILDCEGDILRRVRALVGPDIPVVSVLDPHAHLTDAMVEAASVLIFVKEYPHTDGIDRTEDAVRIIRAMLEEGVRPTPGVFDCRMLGFFPTQKPPMRDFVDSLFAREREPGVVSISFVMGFPWGDTPDTGAKTLVYTDGDPSLAERMAREIHDALWAIRDRTAPDLRPVDEVIGAMLAPRTGPLVVADFADNPGGGAPSDSTYLLRAMLEAGVTGAAIGLIYDPQAVRICHQVGVGGKIALRVGGKLGPASGDPVDLDVEIMGLRRDAEQDVLSLVRFAIGDTAWVRAEGVDIVMGSERIQMYDVSGFTHIGLDPTTRRVLVVKSSNHFHASFSRIAAEILYANTPGALSLNYAAVPYRRLGRPMWPLCEDPFSAP